MQQIQCQLNNPVNLGIEIEDWEFSEMFCEVSDERILEITDNDYTAWISKEMSIGEIFIIGFLIVFLGLFIFRAIWSFFHEKLIRYKSKLDI